MPVQFEQPTPGLRVLPQARPQQGGGGGEALQFLALLMQQRQAEEDRAVREQLASIQEQQVQGQLAVARAQIEDTRSQRLFELASAAESAGVGQIDEALERERTVLEKALRKKVNEPIREGQSFVEEKFRPIDRAKGQRKFELIEQVGKVLEKRFGDADLDDPRTMAELERAYARYRALGIDPDVPSAVRTQVGVLSRKLEDAYGGAETLSTLTPRLQERTAVRLQEELDARERSFRQSLREHQFHSADSPGTLSKMRAQFPQRIRRDRSEIESGFDLLIRGPDVEETPATTAARVRLAEGGGSGVTGGIPRAVGAGFEGAGQFVANLFGVGDPTVREAQAALQRETLAAGPQQAGPPLTSVGPFGAPARLGQAIGAALGPSEEELLMESLTRQFVVPPGERGRGPVDPGAVSNFNQQQQQKDAIQQQQAFLSMIGMGNF